MLLHFVLQDAFSEDETNGYGVTKMRSWGRVKLKVELPNHGKGRGLKLIKHGRNCSQEDNKEVISMTLFP